jgi:hypothetical protein
MRRSTVGILQLSPHSAEKLSQSQMKQHPEHTLLAAWPASQPPMHAILRSQSQTHENINKIS